MSFWHHCVYHNIIFLQDLCIWLTNYIFIIALYFIHTMTWFMSLVLYLEGCVNVHYFCLILFCNQQDHNRYHSFTIDSVIWKWGDYNRNVIVITQRTTAWYMDLWLCGYQFSKVGLAEMVILSACTVLGFLVVQGHCLVTAIIVNWQHTYSICYE